MTTLPEGTLTITHINTVAQDTKLFRFSLNAPLSFQAGQFLSLKFGEKSWRAYSIASLPSDPYIDLLIRIVPEGLASCILDQASVGDTFPFRGPFGHFVLDTEPSRLIFCGTGTGIAPLRSMILTEKQSPNPRPMELWYGGRNQNDIAYLDEIESWDIPTKLAFSQLETSDLPPYSQEHITVYPGRVTQFIETPLLFTSHHSPYFYICGNGDMVKSVEDILKEQNMNKKQIHKERFN